MVCEAWPSSFRIFAIVSCTNVLRLFWQIGSLNWNVFIRQKQRGRDQAYKQGIGEYSVEIQG